MDNSLESFAIDHGSGLPVWVQVKNRIAYLIGSGAYRSGDKLPTVRALAVSLDISYNTVNRAYMDLERDGYITTRKGRGTFVAERVRGMVPSAESSIELLVDEVIHAARAAGMTDEEVLFIVRARLAGRAADDTEFELLADAARKLS